MSELKTTSLSHKDNNTGTPNITMYPDGTTSLSNFTTVSQNGGQLAGFRNLLINSNYGIAQRYSNYPWTATGVISNPNPASLFGPDRWCTTQRREFQSRNERPSNLFPGSIQWRLGTDSNAVWSQVIELLGDGSSAPRLNPLFNSETWTVSHWIFTADRNNFVCDVQYVNESYSPSIKSTIANITDSDWTVVETRGDWTRVAASFSMTGVTAAPVGALGIRVQFRNDANIRAVGAQLEPGSVATPFEQRPIGTELALCQRYYEKLTVGNYITSGTVANGYFGSNFNFSATKRVKPTFSLVHIANSNMNNDGVIQSGSLTTSGGVFRTRWQAINTVTYEYKYLLADAEL
jgi:hypothetical protein